MNLDELFPNRVDDFLKRCKAFGLTPADMLVAWEEFARDLEAEVIYNEDAAINLFNSKNGW